VERDAALLQSKDAEIHSKELKISALTHEIAYYKRIRYSFKSEAFSALQRDIFQEAWNTDMSAIEAELEQLQTKPRIPLQTKPNNPVPLNNHYQHTYRA
jgi:hypothetical protein